MAPRGHFYVLESYPGLSGAAGTQCVQWNWVTHMAVIINMRERTAFFAGLLSFDLRMISSEALVII